MTLAGTQTYVVGKQQAVIIDPGPLLPAHLNAVADAVDSGAHVSIVITHTHPDHAAGAETLAKRLGTEVRHPAPESLIATDGGPLRTVATPGHTADHLAFFLEPERVVFCGDLMMGGMDTALVAVPEGDLHAYLQSLQRLRALRPSIIYPAHGPAFDQPTQAIDRYVQHRLDRVQQVVSALASGPRTTQQLVADIYGAELDVHLRAYAGSAVAAYLFYLEVSGRVRRSGECWSLI
jgi:glyoxylase-like metal-dependent hydrolase (beta-lactamase superfamily II)